MSRDRALDVPESEWQRVIDVQPDSVYRAIQTFAPEMSEGSIVAILPIVSELSTANLPAYYAAKGGTDGFVRAAAEDSP